MANEDKAEDNKQFFVELSEHIEHVVVQTGKIDGLFHDEHIPSPQTDDGAFQRFLERHPDRFGVLGSELTRLVRQSTNLSKQAQQMIDDYHHTWNETIAKRTQQNALDLKHQKALREGERMDMWFSWAQKAVRWSLGMVIVVLLYSGSVAASKEWDWIRIPVKDWVTSSTTATKG